ncbi:hypothetical protein [Vibrio sp. 10N.286.48.B7]
MLIVDKRDPQLLIIARATPQTSLLNILFSDQVPTWLDYVAGNEKGLAIYKLKGFNHE